MGEPILLYGVGATKAGTSWLYRTLADRRDCALPAVKELHYWDTFPAERRIRQVAVFRRQLAGFHDELNAAEAAGKTWRVVNMSRRISDMEGLITTLEGERDPDHTLYRRYVFDRADTIHRIVGDICPSYILEEPTTLRAMAQIAERPRFLYLVRDPVKRLWSAVRMQAERQLQDGEDVGEKALKIMRRILNRGAETHITERGDYGAAFAAMRAMLPPENWRVFVMEEMMTDAGYGEICRWLELPEKPAPVKKVHEGVRLQLPPRLAARAARMLRPQYLATAEHLGRVPESWRAQMEELDC